LTGYERNEISRIGAERQKMAGMRRYAPDRRTTLIHDSRWNILDSVKTLIALVSKAQSLLAIAIATALFAACVPVSDAAENDKQACFAEQRLQTLQQKPELEKITEACTKLIGIGGETLQRAYYNRSLSTFLISVQDRIANRIARDGATVWSLPTRAEIVQAFDDINHAAMKGPLQAQALSLRATYNQYVGLYGDALADLSAAISLQPDNPVSYQQRALEWERQKDVNAALADYDRALKLDPSLSASYIGRGRLLRRIGDVPAALKDFSSAAAQTGPLQAFALVEKSRVEARLGDLTSAYQDIARSAELETYKPSRVSRLVAAGDLARMQLKVSDVARQFYKSALALDPDAWAARLGLADLSLDEGERDNAIKQYESILQATKALTKLTERTLAEVRLWEIEHANVKGAGFWRVSGHKGRAFEGRGSS